MANNSISDGTPSDVEEDVRSQKPSVRIAIDDSLLIPASRQLTDAELEAFHEAFSLFDHKNLGRISCDEFLQTLRRVGINIAEDVARDFIVLHDENGNGELDFEEYLNFMTNEDIFVDLADSLHAPNKPHFKDILLYEVMSKFLTKSSLKDTQKSQIAGYYRRKLNVVSKRGSLIPNVHVVKHFADGARSHTLTEKEILAQIQQMRKLAQSEEDEKLKNSPYADPIQLILSFSGTQKSTRSRTKQPGWNPLKLVQYGVKLPKIHIPEKKTFECLHDIRKKIEDAKINYYWNLKRAQQRNSADIWKNLHVEMIPNERLRNMMKEIYGTYTASRLSGCRVPNSYKSIYRNSLPRVIAPNTSLS